MPAYYHCDEIPPGLFSGPMLAELQRGVAGVGSPSVAVVFSLTGPDGTTRSFSTDATGGADAKLAEVTMPAFGPDIRSDDVPAPEASLTLIDDEDQALAGLVAKYPRSMRGSACELRLVSKNVPNAEDEFTGQMVLDSISLLEPRRWSLRLRANDRPLAKGFHLQEKITAAQWPNAHASALGQCVPWVYGEWSSVGVGGNGSVECPYVDTTGFRYLVSAGRMDAVDAVYADGVLAATSGYSVVYETVGGLWVTLIDFTASQLEKVVTCDVRGLTDKGDGTGTLIRNRVAQLRHWLVNQVWNKWRQGSYYSETTVPLDLASFARVESLIELFSDPEGALHFSGTAPLACQDTFRDLLASSKLKAYWLPTWKLALGLVDPLLPVVPEGDLIDLDIFGTGGFALPYDGGAVVRSMVAQHLYHSAEGAFKGTLTAADLSVPEDVTESLTMPHSPARVK